MTKEQYMRDVEKALERFDDEIRAEVLSDYAEHFQAGLLAGKTEEEICRELGDICEMTRDLRDIMPDSEKAADPATDKETENAAQKTAAETTDKAAGVTADQTAATEPQPGRPVQPEHSERNVPEIAAGRIDENPFRNLVINQHFADITFSDSPDGELHMSCEGDQESYRFFCVQQGDTVYAGIKETGVPRKRKWVIFGTTEDLTISVSLPKMVEKITVNSTSGDLEYDSDCMVGEFILKGLSSDATIRKMHAEKAEIHVTSGDIAIGEFSGREKLWIDTKNGDIDAEMITADKFEATVVSGDIDITAACPVVNMMAVSGDITWRSRVETEAYITTISGDVDVLLRDGSASYAVEFSSISGDMNANGHSFERRGHYHQGVGGSTISIKTTSGDADIEAC